MAQQTVRLEGLDGVLKTLEQLPADLYGKNGGIIAQSMRASLKPMAEDAKANIRKIVAEPNIGETSSESTGLLENSVKVSRRRMPPGTKGERFAIRVARKKYAGSQGSKGRKARTTVKVGALLEYGTEKMSPKPWIRPAFQKNARSTLTRFQTELGKRFDRALKKLARRNGVA